MSDLFKKITQGSIMLWNVDDEKKLPKIKAMGRLLGVTNFKYYKTDGYHSNFIRTLLRMRAARSPDALKTRWSSWPSNPTSHFLFTPQELENNSFFHLTYMASCMGSYFVDEAAMEELSELNSHYDHVRSIADPVSRWPDLIANDQSRIEKDGITDTAVANFDTPGLLKLIDGYGHEAIRDAVTKLDAWQTKHFWKNKATAYAPDDSEEEDKEEEITT
jgi:hypothetical protein